MDRAQGAAGTAPAGPAGAALVLIMTCFVAMAPRTNVLETTADTTPVQTASGDVGPPEITL